MRSPRSDHPLGAIAAETPSAAGRYIKELASVKSRRSHEVVLARDRGCKVDKKVINVGENAVPPFVVARSNGCTHPRAVRVNALRRSAKPALGALTPACKTGPGGCRRRARREHTSRRARVRRPRAHVRRAARRARRTRPVSSTLSSRLRIRASPSRYSATHCCQDSSPAAASASACASNDRADECRRHRHGRRGIR